MDWKAILIIVIALGGFAIAVAYLIYRRVKHMPSLDEECAAANSKTLLRRYHAMKRREARKAEKEAARRS
jgi:hypothetical protein